MLFAGIITVRLQLCAKVVIYKILIYEEFNCYLSIII